MKPLCIYHGNCADGFGAAWVVRRAYRDIKEDYRPEFFAGVYQQPPPDVAEREVFIVDFSYKRPVLLEMAAKAKSIVIIDHHKTAAEDLAEGLPDNVQTVFDMNYSGAMLTWRYFFGSEVPPQLIRHIEDRDLWRFKLHETREIQAAVFSYPYDFEIWDTLMHASTEELIAEGMAIERKHFKDIHELIKITTRKMRIGGYIVPVANLPYTMASDAGHILSEGQPFAACYYDAPDGRNFSLRSSEVGIDVSEIAKKYGGGGHAHAAGFKVLYHKAEEFELWSQ